MTPSGGVLVAHYLQELRKRVQKERKAKLDKENVAGVLNISFRVSAQQKTFHRGRIMFFKDPGLILLQMLSPKAQDQGNKASRQEPFTAESQAGQTQQFYFNMHSKMGTYYKQR